MSTFRFQCPHCKSVRSIHARMLGREIPCPDCEGKVQLPTEEQVAAAKQAKAEAAQKAAQATRWKEQLAAADQGEESEEADQSAVAATSSGRRESAAVEEEELDPPMQMKKREVPKDDMDMTPMVDVTFLLLIFFMITANFTMQKSIQVPAEKSDEASSQAVPQIKEMEESVTVQIDEFNSYTVLFPDGTERDAASKQDLIGLLEEARLDSGAEDEVTKLIVQAHQDCIHQAVIQALDAGRTKGFSSFQVSVVEEFD
ncbi:MAG: ExbD/TolR family protein [Pirellulaceae bacterium]|jgi:biopolymer transport protein ExbD